MGTKTLQVEGMSCGHCKKSVEGALHELKGVEKAEVDLDAETVEVKYDDAKVEADEFATAISEAGPYQVV